MISLPRKFDLKSARRGSTRRGNRGSAIAEFAPALIILFLIMFFPAVDLLFMAMKYLSCQALYATMLQAASKGVIVYVPPSSKAGQSDTSCCTGSGGSGDKLSTMASTWKSVGLGQFVAPTSGPSWNTTVIYDSSKGLTQFVQLDMTITVSVPFPIPFVGIGSAVPFEFKQVARIEDARGNGF